MILKRVLINNKEFDEFRNLKIDNSISENNNISSFNCSLNNFDGINKDKFSIGNEATIFSNVDSEAPIKIFGGYVTNKSFTGEEISDEINITSCDYTTDLMDTTILPEVYNNISCGSIVRDVMQKYAQDINITPVGTSLYYPGNSYLNISGTIAENIEEQSFNLWIKPFNSIGSNVSSQTIFEFGNKSLYLLPSGVIYAVGSAETTNAEAYSNEWAVSGATWVNVNYNYSDTGDRKIYLYLNGTEISYSGSQISSVGSLYSDSLFKKEIGSAYNGNIDEFKVYNKVLSEAEIGSEYNAGQGTLGTSGENLKCLFHFDEATGKTLTDCNNNIATLSGANYPCWDTGIVKLNNNYIDEGIDLAHVVFNHKPIIDGIKYLAEKSGYIFYVDVYKNLHFKDKSSIDSGYTFSSGNILSADFEEDDSEIKNDVWVYGDRTLTAWENDFVADGVGSIFTIEYKPHNTEVLVNDVLQKGWPLNMTIDAPSGTNYLVGFEEKQVVFINSAEYGNSIPTSGAIVQVAYQKDVPIVKYLENPSSKQTYGIKTHVELNKEITSPEMAYEVAKNLIDRYGEPLKEGNINLIGINLLNAGQTCVVDIPNQSINEETFDIINVTYDFSPENCLSNTAINIKVSQRIKDITDTLKQIILDIKKLQGADVTETEIITRYQFATGSIATKTNYEVYTRDYLTAGSCGIYDHPVYGIYDAGLVYDGLTGSAFTDWEIQTSGGQY